MFGSKLGSRRCDHSLVGRLIHLGARTLALNDTIAHSLIGTICSIPREWQHCISLESGIEDELRQLSMTAPTNSVEFLRFLLASRQRLREAILISTLPEDLTAQIADLVARRSEMRSRKEVLVNERKFDEAARCLALQKSLTDELNNKLAGQALFVTIGNVTDAISQIGWPENDG